MYSNNIKIISEILLPSIYISSSLNIYNKLYNKQFNMDYKYFYYCYSSV
jgi:hypothetical protein